MSRYHRLFPHLMLCSLALAEGCARYEYDLVVPPDLAQHVGSKTSATFPLDPLRYEARSSNDHLVLLLFNDTSDPIKLLGDDSYAVDQNEQSHPLPTRTIAPWTSTKLIFPPVRPTFRQSGSSVGIGLGVGIGRVYGRRGFSRGGFAGDPYFYDNTPRYYRLEDDGTLYWDWTGDATDVKLRLVFQRGDKQFHHDLAFRRMKV